MPGDFYNAWKTMHRFGNTRKFEKKSTEIQSFTYRAITMPKLRNYYRYELRLLVSDMNFVNQLNHTTHFSKLFLTQLISICIWNIIDLIEYYGHMIYSINLPQKIFHS